MTNNRDTSIMKSTSTVGKQGKAIAKTTASRTIVNGRMISSRRPQPTPSSTILTGGSNRLSTTVDENNIIYMALSTEDPRNYFVRTASSVRTFLDHIRNLDGSPLFDLVSGIGPFSESPSDLLTEIEENIRERCNRSNQEHNFSVAVKFGHVLNLAIEHHRSDLRMFYTPISALEGVLAYEGIGDLDADVLLRGVNNGLSTMASIGLNVGNLAQQVNGETSPTAAAESAPTAESQSRTVSIQENGSDDSTSNIALERELADIDMTQYQTPNIARGNGGRVINPYSTPTSNRSEPKATLLTSYPPNNAVSSDPYNTPTSQPRPTPPEQNSIHSNGTNDGLAPGLTLVSIMIKKDNCPRKVMLANHQTRCRLCDKYVNYSDWIEHCAVLNKQKKVMFTRWDHVYGNCNNPERRPTQAEMNRPVNGITVIDITNHEWIRWTTDVPSHHNSAPVQATRADSFVHSQRSVNSAPPAMPPNIILPIINNRNIEPTFTLQPRNSEHSADLNQGGSLSSTHSELTPVTFAHAPDSHHTNTTEVQPSAESNAYDDSSVQPNGGNLNEETFVDGNNQVKTSNTCDSVQSDDELIAIAAVDEACRLQGRQPIQPPKIGESAEDTTQINTFVLHSVVNEAFRVTTTAAYSTPEDQVRAGVRYIQSGGITDEMFLSRASEELQRRLRDYEVQDNNLFDHFDMEQPLGDNEIFRAGNDANEELNPTKSNPKDLSKECFKTEETPSDIDSKQDASYGNGEDLIDTDDENEVFSAGNNANDPKDPSKECFKTEETPSDIDSKQDASYGNGEDLIDTDDENEKVQEQAQKCIEFLKARAKNGVKRDPEHAVKRLFGKTSTKDRKQKVAKATRKALGMKERRIISKRERINRKNNTKNKKNESHNDSSSCNTHESKLNKKNTGPKPQFEKGLYNERKRDEYQPDGFLQESESDDDWKSAEGNDDSDSSDSIDKKNIIESAKNMREKAMKSHKFINVSHCKYFDESAEESTSAGFSDDESHDSDTFGGSSTRSEDNINDDTKKRKADSDEEYEFEEGTDESNESDELSGVELDNGHDDDINGGRGAQGGGQTTLEDSWEFAERRDASK